MYICKTMRLCSFLIEKGFRFELMRPDIFNPKFNVWEFKETPELWKAITEYSNRDKSKDN